MFSGGDGGNGCDGRGDVAGIEVIQTFEIFGLFCREKPSAVCRTLRCARRNIRLSGDIYAVYRHNGHVVARHPLVEDDFTLSNTKALKRRLRRYMRHAKKHVYQPSLL